MAGPDRGRALVLGVSGPVVVVPHELALVVLDALRPWGEQLRRGHAPIARPFADLVAALELAVDQGVRQAMSDCGHAAQEVVDVDAAVVHRERHNADEYVCISELAKSDSQQRQLRRRAKAGQLPGARKVGGTWLVPAGALERSGFGSAALR
jgi:hypothetical protein